MSKNDTKRLTLRVLEQRLDDAKQLNLNAFMALASRGDIAAALGKSYGGDRELYTALGYKTDITFSDYRAMYERQEVAKAVIDTPVRACWRMPPDIVEAESETEETAFEKAWVELQERLNIFHYLSRVDRLAGVGQYAVLLIGYDDGLDWDQPVQGKRDIAYLMAYDESAAEIKTYDEDITSTRFGQPLYYKVTTAVGGNTKPLPMVHYTRLLHVVNDPIDNDVLGTPVLRCIFNRLQDLEKIVGGSGEMFWRGAFPGLDFSLRENASLGPQDIDELSTQIEQYIHGMQRHLRTEGIDIKTIDQQIADPSSNVSVILDGIAAATRIPRRILLGSERGELASSQDEKSWADHVDQRRRDQCEMRQIRPFIDSCIEFGVLPTPAAGYNVEWADLLTPSDKDKAEVAEILTRALKNYVEALGADEVIPVPFFLREFMELTPDQLVQIEDTQIERDREVNAPEPEEDDDN